MIRALCTALLLGAAATAVLAAPERDPTLAPPGALAGPAGGAPVDDPAKPVLPPNVGAAVLVQGGKPYLVLGSQMLSPGQKIGAFTLERIGETEVWLRNGKALHKVSIFSGIERHTATERPTP